MSPIKRLLCLASLAVLFAPSAIAQRRPDPPKTPRIYIFDNGSTYLE